MNSECLLLMADCLAAWSALVTVAQSQPGETILVTGVSGAVGRAATQRLFSTQGPGARA